MTEDEKRELADVYEKAAEYLEEYGWIQGEAGEPGSARCMVGAMSSALGFSFFLSPLQRPVLDKARNFAEQVLEIWDSYATLAYWNDDPSRTKDEVINVLHGLANKLR